jgi:hypothetical protein
MMVTVWRPRIRWARGLWRALAVEGDSRLFLKFLRTFCGPTEINFELPRNVGHNGVPLHVTEGVDRV